jgi:archaellum component FlaC
LAEISKETIDKILELMGRLSILIDKASSSELTIFNIYGETQEMSDVLEQLQNTKERGISSYSRLSSLLLKISEVQPSASAAIVNMLNQSIQQAQATVDAGEATVKEAKNDWSIQ